MKVIQGKGGVQNYQMIAQNSFFYPDYSDLRINISKTLITYQLIVLLKKYFQIPTAVSRQPANFERKVLITKQIVFGSRLFRLASLKFLIYVFVVYV